MRIIVAHNRYRSDSPSGENIAVDRQIETLKHHGIDIVEFFRHSDDLAKAGKFTQLLTGLRLVGWPKRRRELAVAIESMKADVLHVHNLFPLFGPDLWQAARDVGIPVVQTVHNHRLFASATHFIGQWGAKLPTNDEEVEQLKAISPLHNTRLTDRLYHRAMIQIWAKRLPINCVDAWVVHSGWHRNLVEQVGIPRNRIAVILHSLEHMGPVGNTAGDHALFVGRLAAEKGLDLLAKGWPKDLPLQIIGDGPQADLVKRLWGDQWLGRRPSNEVAERMAKARFLVVPSVVVEGGGVPLVALEALAAGTPVLSTDLGAMPRMIAYRKVGWQFSYSDPETLGPAAYRAWEEAPALRSRCRKVFNDDHDPEMGVNRLIDLYRAVMAGNEPAVASEELTRRYRTIQSSEIPSRSRGTASQ